LSLLQLCLLRLVLGQLLLDILLRLLLFLLLLLLLLWLYLLDVLLDLCQLLKLSNCRLQFEQKNITRHLATPQHFL